MNWIAAIGLEVHVQLATRTKIFCSCPNRFGAEPNRLTCPVCLGYPGALPSLNLEAVRLAVRAALLLGCRVRRESAFDRKSYTYPDMPKNYQISQRARPLALGGGLEIEDGGGRRTVALGRVHLEEDVGRCLHFGGDSGLDFNRAGVPLLEIVTRPALETPDEALAFLRALRRLLVHGGISGCRLDQGNVRCDLNVSVRPRGDTALGRKVEIKNLNTFKGVRRALAFEIERQIGERAAGRPVRRETRRWDGEAGVTRPMRAKEDARDYRYLPEPDLPPLRLERERIEAWRAGLPERPADRRARFAARYGLPERNAVLLTAGPDRADFFEAVVAAGAAPGPAANWILTGVLGALARRGMEFSGLRFSPRALAELIGMVERRALSRPAARRVFDTLFEEGGEPAGIARRLGLGRIQDPGAIEALARRAVEENPAAAGACRAGKTAALQHLVGRVLGISGGAADPALAAGALRRLLGLTPGRSAPGRSSGRCTPSRPSLPRG